MRERVRRRKQIRYPRPHIIPIIRIGATSLLLWLFAPAYVAATVARNQVLPPAFEPEGDGAGTFRARTSGLAVRVLPGALEFVARVTHDRESRLRMTLEGANRNCAPEPLEKLPGYANYLLGRDPSRWETFVPRYRGVMCRNLYPGIDLVVYVRREEIEYDWNVSAGADPGRIRLTFDKPASVRVDESGNLVAKLGLLKVIQRRPDAYQTNGTGRSRVPAAFELVSHHGARLRLGSYNTAMPLVVDPTLAYTIAGYDGAGGSGDEEGNAIAVDRQGSVYVTGTRHSSDSVGSGGTYVVKLDPAGEVVFATYLSGGGKAIAVDQLGNIYIAGNGDQNAPLVKPLPSAYIPCDSTSTCVYGYIAELNPQGSAVLFSTLIGTGFFNPANPIVESLNAIVLGPSVAGGPSQSIAFVGRTQSASLPVTSQAFQQQVNSGKCLGCATGFVGVLAPGGAALSFLTYLGGSGNDIPSGVGADATGVYVGGSTSSVDFPTTTASFQPRFAGEQPNDTDGFVAKLNPGGSELVYSTYLGAGEIDALAVDGQTAYVAGAAGPGFTTTPGVFRTAPPSPADGGPGLLAAAKLTADGSSLVYSTFLGYGQARSMAVQSGVAYLAGITNSVTYPVVNAVQEGITNRGTCLPADGPCFDGFISILNANGTALTFSTYLGGDNINETSWVNGIAVDALGNTYVTGYNGSGSDFPGVAPGSKAGSSAFITKISPEGVTPVFSERSITNAIGYTSGGLTPGELITIFGANFSQPGIFSARELPLPTDLDGASVTINGVPAPILAVANVNGQEQINAQVPYDFIPSGTYPVLVPIVVTTAFGRSVTMWVHPQNSGQNSGVLWGTPGIVTTDGVHGTVQHSANYSLVNASHPAAPGEILILYASGLGAVTPPVASGAAAPSSPLSFTDITPSVTVGGVPATVLFSGLVPGYVGLYQINFRLALNTPAGDEDLAVTSGNSTSNIAKLAVGK
jgi:uncharacterized protein (TIGR03437 family)